MTLQSARLDLVAWQPADLETLRRLATMPEVTRYVGDGLPWPPERVAEVHDRVMAHWLEHGFGWRVVAERASGATIGLIALSFAGDGVAIDPFEYEIGWWLDPAAWGRGYAREAAATARDEALGVIGAPSVVARIQPANGRSIAVATALGMTYESSVTGRFGEPCDVYRLK